MRRTAAIQATRAACRASTWQHPTSRARPASIASSRSASADGDHVGRADVDRRRRLRRAARWPPAPSSSLCSRVAPDHRRGRRRSSSRIRPASATDVGPAASRSAGGQRRQHAQRRPASPDRPGPGVGQPDQRHRPAGCVGTGLERPPRPRRARTNAAAGRRPPPTGGPLGHLDHQGARPGPAHRRPSATGGQRRAPGRATASGVDPGQRRARGDRGRRPDLRRRRRSATPVTSTCAHAEHRRAVDHPGRAPPTTTHRDGGQHHGARPRGPAPPGARREPAHRRRHRVAPAPAPAATDGPAPAVGAAPGPARRRRVAAPAGASATAPSGASPRPASAASSSSPISEIGGAPMVTTTSPRRGPAQHLARPRPPRTATKTLCSGGRSIGGGQRDAALARARAPRRGRRPP